MSVQLINNRLLRILQNHQAKCEKTNDDLENAAYLCTVLADVSNVNSVKIESDFNFESQDVKVIGITPSAHALMENIKNATDEYDTLLQSNIYILDHCDITANKRNYTFNITGIIDDRKFNLSNYNLTLKINSLKEEDTIEVDTNCTIININGSNYTLNCLGEKNVLYDLQSSISYYDNNILLVNFDENSTSEIRFSSDSYKFRKENTGGLSTGIIVTIVLVILILVATIITLVFLRKKIFLKKQETSQESTVVRLNIISN